MKFRTIILSDIHLGSTYSKAKDVVDFLKMYECETLILNGDIIDGWALKRGERWTDEHMKCLRKIMKLSNQTEIYWLRGNHDDFLTEFIPISMGNINVKEQISYEGINGKKYLVLHGDIFDVFTVNMKWLANLGSIGYDICLWINKWYNKFRDMMGYEYFSLSKIIKDSVKAATKYVGEFEKHMVNHANNFGYDGVICGHIHKAEITKIDGIEYMNSGDWVESKTALVEDYEGKWFLINF